MNLYVDEIQNTHPSPRSYIHIPVTETSRVKATDSLLMDFDGVDVLILRDCPILGRRNLEDVCGRKPLYVPPLTYGRSTAHHGAILQERPLSESRQRRPYSNLAWPEQKVTLTKVS